MSVFGELSFDQSRAVDEDDDFIPVQEDLNLKRKIYWLTEDYQLNKLKVDELIVADGSIAAAFVCTYLISNSNLSAKILALSANKSEYNVYQTNKEDLESHQKNLMLKIRDNFIYFIPNLNGKSYVVCQLFNQLKSNEIYDWIDQLWSRIEFISSLVICNKNNMSYFGANIEQFPCVKYLSSDDSSNLDDHICTRLEEPNFIGDLPAAIIHFSMLKNLTFKTFICYSSTIGPDLQSLKKIFESLNFKLKNKTMFSENENSNKLLMSLGNIVNSVSSLYM